MIKNKVPESFRKFVKDKCYYTNKNHNKISKGKYKRYRELMQELTLELKEYQMLKRCFMGGFTHASLNYVGELVEDVTSIDFTSSYPSVMLAEKYPMSKPTKVDLRKENFELEQLTSGLKYPEIIVTSVNEKNRAVQQAQQAENELKVVQAEAQKKVTAAQAEAESYKLKTQSLTPSILKQMWIDKWDGKLPTVSSNGGMMLNLNDLK